MKKRRKSLHIGMLPDHHAVVDGFELTMDYAMNLFCFSNVCLYKIPSVIFAQNPDILSLKHITIPGFMLQASFNI